MRVILEYNISHGSTFHVSGRLEGGAATSAEEIMLSA